MRVGTAEAAPGTVARGVIPVPGLAEAAYPPVLVAAGSRPGPVLAVTGGVHGAEYSSIEAARRVAASARPEELAGTLIVVPIVTVEAFYDRSIYVHPLDGKNPNRQYPGRATGSASERVAAALFEQVIARADAFCDLHGGDMVEALVPFVGVSAAGSPEVRARSLDMARAFGIEEVVLAETRGSTYGAAAAAGKPAILAEAGGQGILSEPAAGLLARGVRRLQQHLGMAAGDPEPLPVRERAGWTWFTSPCTGLWYPAAGVGETVAAGRTLGRFTDVWGTPLGEVTASAAGRLMWCVSALAMREGQALCAVALA